jgi:hypothetical protein
MQVPCASPSRPLTRASRRRAWCLSLIAGVLYLAMAATLAAQAPDTLTLSNGELLIGDLEHADASAVAFKSDSAGALTIPWTKIRELRAPHAFAVIRKGVGLRTPSSFAAVPRGALTVINQTMTVTAAAGAPLTMPVGDILYVVDDTIFQTHIERNPGFFETWTGTMTAGASTILATQDNRTFTGSVDLVRTVPAQTWLATRNRTTVDFTGSYGAITQPATPSIKTDILHADVERDEYVTGRVYAFAQGTWDHNFSQGLDLQQAYGGGFGRTVRQTAVDQLDLTASVVYTRQAFQLAADNHDLVGSTFAQSYHRKWAGGASLIETVSVTPSWNVPSAYSAVGNLALNLPVYKVLGATFKILDNYLNDPPSGFQKNSFQFIAGATYTVQ